MTMTQNALDRLEDSKSQYLQKQQALSDLKAKITANKEKLQNAQTEADNLEAKWKDELSTEGGSTPAIREAQKEAAAAREVAAELKKALTISDSEVEEAELRAIQGRTDYLKHLKEARLVSEQEGVTQALDALKSTPEFEAFIENLGSYLKTVREQKIQNSYRVIDTGMESLASNLPTVYRDRIVNTEESLVAKHALGALCQAGLILDSAQTDPTFTPVPESEHENRSPLRRDSMARRKVGERIKRRNDQAIQA